MYPSWRLLRGNVAGELGDIISDMIICSVSRPLPFSSSIDSLDSGVHLAELSEALG
jgi:hypothetical protein